ncbi:MAG: dihydroorotate dehydrogenase [Planctomycetota bacterium]|nr:dihydroorotate dehydrogenase [Planctomycetota bacterium]
MARVPNLAVKLNRLSLRNPILVASGTFGYAREMTAFAKFDQLGGIIPKTITPEPRVGNPPPRTVETTSGLLNSIGLDNDGLEHFLESHLPKLCELPTSVIANIAGHDVREFQEMASALESADGLDGVELNISCPNVSGGIDFGTNPELAAEVVSCVRSTTSLPVIAKLTPNVTDIVSVASAVAAAGADAVSLVNTYQGMAIDWRRKRPVLGNVTGGLSGPAIKPLALCAVWKVARAVDIPIIGVGGISCIDDVMEFLVAGASAVQIGTASFFDPGLSSRLMVELDACLADLGVDSVTEMVGTLDGEPADPAGD